MIQLSHLTRINLDSCKIIRLIRLIKLCMRTRIPSIRSKICINNSWKQLIRPEKVLRCLIEMSQAAQEAIQLCFLPQKAIKVIDNKQVCRVKAIWLIVEGRSSNRTWVDFIRWTTRALDHYQDTIKRSCQETRRETSHRNTIENSEIKETWPLSKRSKGSSLANQALVNRNLISSTETSFFNSSCWEAKRVTWSSWVQWRDLKDQWTSTKWGYWGAWVPFHRLKVKAWSKKQWSSMNNRWMDFVDRMRLHNSRTNWHLIVASHRGRLNRW